MAGVEAAELTPTGAARMTTHGQIYGEEGLRYWLSIQRARSARTRDATGLVLVDVRDDAGRNAVMDPPVAARVFSALWSCVRASDVVGWYRSGCVVGVLLTTRDSRDVASSCACVARRIEHALRTQLPRHIADRVRVWPCMSRDRTPSRVADAVRVPAR